MIGESFENFKRFNGDITDANSCQFFWLLFFNFLINYNLFNNFLIIDVLKTVRQILQREILK